MSCRSAVQFYSAATSSVVNEFRSDSAAVLNKLRKGALGSGKVTKIMETLKEKYDEYFEVWPANEANLLEEVFHLRYQVYCIENPFEPIANNPGERETDQFDEHSLHSLLMYRPTKKFVGTTRLILPYNQNKPVDLPIRTLVSDGLWSDVGKRVPLNQAAEISRFAIAKEFRRRAEDQNSLAGGLNEQSDPRRVIPHISLGLMRSLCMMASIKSVVYLFAVMEPALLRMLRKLSIHFEDLGPVVDHHGRRQPCYCNLSCLLDRTARERRDVWEVLTDNGKFVCSPVKDVSPTVEWPRPS